MPIMNAIKFSVLRFCQGLVDVHPDQESLTTCNRVALRRGGYYSDLWLVDSTQRKFKVAAAKKLYGIGLFWGYNIFLNQRIRVELMFSDDSKEISLDEVKGAVFKSFRNWHGWGSSDTFDELQAKVKAASSIAELVDALEDPAHRRK